VIGEVPVKYWGEVLFTSTSIVEEDEEERGCPSGETGKDCIAQTPVCPTKRFDRSSDWLGWSDPVVFWPRPSGKKWGRSSPTRCHSATKLIVRVMRNFFSFV
jgi:hypothetical protein